MVAADEVTWIHAKDALQSLKPLVFEDEWSAIDELRVLAAAGVGRTRAEAIRRRRGSEYSFAEAGPLDSNFWEALSQQQADSDSVEDWQGNRFRCRMEDGEIVEASGVQFCVDDLRRWLIGFAPVAPEQQTEEAGASRRGRRPANWWPAVLEEALVDYHENGWPKGENSEGIEIVIERLLARLAIRGIEPSRASLQGPIRSVLLRFRSSR